ncbi:MAG: hypothetical protein KIT44_09410 [Opitutaceae bacterium]|nr:hypothetical protein [Opitutaceae bacterium]
MSRWPEPQDITHRTPFSEVYEQYLRAVVETDVMMTEAFGYDPKREADHTFSDIHEMTLSGWWQRVPKDQQRTFFLELCSEAERLIKKLNPEDKGPPLV